MLANTSSQPMQNKLHKNVINARISKAQLIASYALSYYAAIVRRE
jgi:hypothetical protein